jgi:hypothetical protein
MTKLVDGMIPVGSICPFKDKCELKEACYHTGKFHRSPYSCALARGFDLMERKQLTKGETDGYRKGEALSG